jgi:hypothetical protein
MSQMIEDTKILWCGLVYEILPTLKVVDYNVEQQEHVVSSLERDVWYYTTCTVH